MAWPPPCPPPWLLCHHNSSLNSLNSPQYLCFSRNNTYYLILLTHWTCQGCGSGWKLSGPTPVLETFKSISVNSNFRLTLTGNFPVKSFKSFQHRENYQIEVVINDFGSGWSGCNRIRIRIFGKLGLASKFFFYFRIGSADPDPQHCCKTLRRRVTYFFFVLLYSAPGKLLLCKIGLKMFKYLHQTLLWNILIFSFNDVFYPYFFIWLSI